MTADFHPLDAYSTDELIAALDRRCFGVFVALLPKKVVGEGPTYFHFINWTDYKGLELIGAVDLGHLKFVEQVRDGATPSAPAPDDATGDDE